MTKVWGRDLYIIAAGPELTKLGRSQHPQKRLQEISRGMPFQPCRLHRELALGHEKRGEWYRCSAETVAATVVRRLGSLEEGEDP